MLRKLTVFSLFFPSLFVSGFDNRLEELMHLRYFGHKEEALVLVQKYLKKKAISEEDYLLAKILEIQLHESQFYFEKAGKLRSNMMDRIQQKSTPRIWLAVEQLAHTGLIKQAMQLLPEEILTPLTLEDVDNTQSRALIYYKLGYFTRALAATERIETRRLQWALGSSQPKEKYFAENEPHRVWLHRRYVELILIKIQSLMALGQYKSAHQQWEFILEHAKKQIDVNDPIFQNLYEVGVLLAQYERDPEQQLERARQAYLQAKTPESDPITFTALVRFIEALYATDAPLEAQNYLRRLQMQSYRNLGNNDPLQFAYDYSVAIKMYYQGDVVETLRILRILQSKYNYLPKHTSYYKMVEDLSIKVYTHFGYFKEAQLALHNKYISDTLYMGHQSMTSRLSLIHKKSFEAKYLGDHKSFYTSDHAELLKKTLTLDTGIIKNPIYLQGLYLYNQIGDRFGTTHDIVASAIKYLEEEISNRHPYLLLQKVRLCHALIMMGNLPQALDLQKQITTQLSELNSKDESLLDVWFILFDIQHVLGETKMQRTIVQRINAALSLVKNPSFYTQTQAILRRSTGYLETGNFNKANAELNMAYRLLEKNGLMATAYSLSFNRLKIKLQIEKGLYNGVAQEIDKSLQSVLEGSLLYAQLLTLRASYLLAIADVGKAYQTAVESYGIFEKLWPNDHFLKALQNTQKANLAFIAAKESDDAIGKTYKNSINYLGQSLGTSSGLYLQSAKSGLLFYIESNKLALAEQLLNKLLVDDALSVPNKSPFMASLYFLRGQLKYKQGAYKEAEKSYVKAADLFENLFDNSHPEYLKSKVGESKCKYMMAGTKDALALMSLIIPKYYTYTRLVFPYLSFSQKAKFWSSFKEDLDYYTFLVAERPDKSNKVPVYNLYNTVIATKGILLSSDIRLKQAIKTSKDSTLIKLYQQWLDAKDNITYAYTLSKTELEDQKIDIKQLEISIEKLERSLSERSSAFKNDNIDKTIVVDDIRKSLTEGEYAVEIVRYRKFNKILTDTAQYAALLIGKSRHQNTEMVIIPNGNDLESRNYSYYRNHMTAKTPDDLSYDVYWKKIKESMPDAKTIYFAGDGVYNQINVETLTNNSTTFEIDNHSVVYVLNTKDLAKRLQAAKNLNDIVLCGNPKYYAADYTSSTRSIKDLKGAELEIQVLNKTLLASNRPHQVYYQDQITESFVRQMNKPSIFHIATHGYFKESARVSFETGISNPMLNSGILLVNSGNILDSQDESRIYTEDGILTAQEVTEINFDGTQLVILSACETGRGNVQVGEGVFGLQRAFFIAGARAIVLSLFKVDDAITQELMVTFYKKLLATGNVRQSFQMAKMEIKQLHKEPIYWGAFMLVEAYPKAEQKIN